MIYVFDTSAINELHNDSERQFLVTGLLATNNPRISALNVIEAVGTKDDQLRRSLVNLLKTLSHGFRPLATPNTLLKIITNAYERNDRRPDISSPEEEDSIWIALNSPDELDEETRQEVLDWKISLESPFTDAHREARPQLQALFESGDAPRPRSVAQLIRYYRDNDELILESLVELYQHITSRPCPFRKPESLFVISLTGLFTMLAGHIPSFLEQLGNRSTKCVAKREQLICGSQSICPTVMYS
jgi:hypothetical protein